MPGPWMQLYLRHERARRRQKFHEAHLANVRAWAEQVQILDLQDPHGKRLLFEGLLQRSKEPLKF